MKLITEKESFDLVNSCKNKIINKNALFPENVFREELKFFVFLEFYDVLTASFFKSLKKYLLAVDENYFWVSSADPEPEYYQQHFDYFGTMEFNVSDTEKDYTSALIDYPEGSAPDSFMHHGEVLLFLSSLCKWALYADRENNLVICAFATKEQKELFESIYDSERLYKLKEVVDYILRYDFNKELGPIFYRNYSLDTPLRADFKRQGPVKFLVNYLRDRNKDS